MINLPGFSSNSGKDTASPQTSKYINLPGFTPTTNQSGVTTSPTPQTPKTAMSGSLGGGYGASNITDTSGKPLLTYENQKTQSSQLLSDRTAPGFDPTVAQKVDPVTLQDPRMKESVSQQLKSQLGGSTFNELDHIMPLELGGSNNQSNLRLESGADTTTPYSPGKNPTPTDPLENQLATKVHNGDISLADSWKLMAQAKGIVLPEQGGTVPTMGQFPAKPKTLSTQEAAQAVALNFFPGTMQSLSELQLDPLSLKADPSKALSDRAKSMESAIGQESVNIVNFFKSFGSGKTTADKVSAGTNVAIGVVNVGISPLTSLFAAANDIPVLGSMSRLVGVFFNALGEGVNLTAHAIAAQTIQKIPGLSQDSKDKITDAYAKINSIAYQFGVPMAAEDIAGLKSRLEPKFGEQDAQTIINAGKNLAEGKDILAKPTLSDIADQPETETSAESKGNVIQKNPSTESVAKNFEDQTKNNYENLKSQYKAKFGNVISADNAKELSPEYNNGVDSRAKFSDVIQPSASRFANRLYDDAIQENKDTGNGDVVMTAGGTGAGKSRFIEGNQEADAASVVYDGNMDNFGTAKRRINLAVDNGYNVKINYVFRDAEEAYRNGVLSRGENEGGRTVTTQGHVDTHVGSLETIQKIAEEYKNNPNVEIKVWENSPNGLVEKPIDFLSNKVYDKDTLKTNLENITNEEHSQGNISTRTRDAALRGRTEGVARKGESAGREGSGEHQSNSERVSTKAKTENKTLQRGGEEGVSGISKKNGRDKGIIREKGGSEKEVSSKITKSKVRYAKQLKPIEGIGEEKVRGLSKGVEVKAIASTPSRLPSFAPEEAKGIERSAVAQKLTDIFGELPTYKTMNVADQGARAIDLFEKDPEAAKQIAYGAKTPPKGLTPEAVYIAVEQHAIENQDIQTLKELANSRLTQEATTMGQRIRMLAERNPERPTDAIRAVQEARVKAVQDKIGQPVEKAKVEIVKKEAPKLQDAIEKAKSTRKISWSDFAESLKC